MPRSLRAQTLVVVLLGLALSHAIGIVIYSWDRGEAVASTEALDVTDRVSGLVLLLGKLPALGRDEIVQAANSRTFNVFLSPSAAFTRQEGDTLSEEIAADLSDDLHGWPEDRIVVALNQDFDPVPRFRVRDPRKLYQASPSGFARVSREHNLVNISVGLEDGQWLNFIGVVPKATPLFPEAAIAYVLPVIAGVMALAIWLVQRVTSPLTFFARAAEELGRNIRSDPLPERGPEEVRRASRAFNEMQARLRRLVENRTQMLAAISHDLRTPLTLLRLRAELLGKSDSGAQMIRTLDEMETLIGSILDFAKQTFEEEPQRTVDLAALLESLCDDLADGGAAVAFAPAPELPYRCRRAALKRAFTNLIDNAVKYGRRAQVRLARLSAAVEVTVEDEGPGIPDEQIAQVFMPFHRGDPSRSRDTGGTGLGLSIAQTIVHGHGGTIELVNCAEGGLRVRILLPL